MAGASLLTLLDDIAALMDDVAVMSKLAVKKTAGVLGDDLAVNAEQVSGVKADRELPVIWSVAKGSMLNKVILVPSALAISAFIPWLITPLLMLGGLFLCFEGAEKLIEMRNLKPKAEREQINEKEKIKGAIRTDFILSAEIIVLTLGVVAAQPFATQATTLATIAFFITLFVYGLVAVIVKIDDVGLHLTQQGKTGFGKAIGRGLLALAPKLMKSLSWVGTIAMFLVGGGILVHGVHSLAVFIENTAQFSAEIPAVGVVLSSLVPTLMNGLVGIVVGFITVFIVSRFHKH